MAVSSKAWAGKTLVQAVPHREATASLSNSMNENKWPSAKAKQRAQDMSSRSLSQSVKRFFRRSSEAAYDASRFDSGYKTLNEEYEEQGGQPKGEIQEKREEDQLSLTTALESGTDVLKTNEGPSGPESDERGDMGPCTTAIPPKPGGNSLPSTRHGLEGYATVPTKLDNFAEDFVDQYKRLWIESQNNPTPLNYNASQDFFGTIEAANSEFSNRGTQSAFESLLRCAMDLPTAIDFLIQVCWGAMGHFPDDTGRKAFHQWLADLPISPQPKTPVLGNAYNMKKQPGAVRTMRQKRCARIITAAILSRCIAFDILLRSSDTAALCFEHEFECLKRARATDEVDFIAACVFLRGCAGSWTSFRVGKLPNLLNVHKAVLQDWRYNSSISLLVENLATKPHPHNESSAVLFESKQWVN